MILQPLGRRLVTGRTASSARASARLRGRGLRDDVHAGRRPTRLGSPRYRVRAAHHPPRGTARCATFVCIPIPGDRRWRVSLMALPDVQMTTTCRRRRRSTCCVRRPLPILRRERRSPICAGRRTTGSATASCRATRAAAASSPVTRLHIHPPIGGQGMNTGHRTRAPRVAARAFAAGRAAPGLLDGYARSTRPVGLAACSATHRMDAAVTTGDVVRPVAPGLAALHRLSRQPLGRGGDPRSPEALPHAGPNRQRADAGTCARRGSRSRSVSADACVLGTCCCSGSSADATGGRLGGAASPADDPIDGTLTRSRRRSSHPARAWSDHERFPIPAATRRSACSCRGRARLPYLLSGSVHVAFRAEPSRRDGAWRYLERAS